MAAKKTGLVRSDGKEVIAYMGDVLAHALEQHGKEKREASEIALDVMGRMRREFGGQNIYFPKGCVLDQGEKYAEIYDKYLAGAAISDLAYEYGFSVVWTYAVIASERARRRARRDAELDMARAR